MAGRYLLDTNVLIDLLGGKGEFRDRLIDAEEVFLPTIGLGELYYGAFKSGRPRDNESRIDDLAAANATLGDDTDTARMYGRVKEELRRRGRPIPDNDIWIASLALQHDLTLVTRDEHFRQVEGLRVEAW